MSNQRNLFQLRYLFVFANSSTLTAIISDFLALGMSSKAVLAKAITLKAIRRQEIDLMQEARNRLFG